VYDAHSHLPSAYPGAPLSDNARNAEALRA